MARTYPLPDERIPPLTGNAARTPHGFMLWVARIQASSIALGAGWGSVWMLGVGLIPAAVGRAVDRGVVPRDGTAVLGWSLGIVGMAAVIAFAGARRHYNAVTNWLSAAYIVLQLLSRQAVRVGAGLPGMISSGEVVAIGAGDAESMANFFDVLARLAGSTVTVAVVAVIMLEASWPVGLVVLIGVPVTMALTAWLLRPLQRRQERYREQQAELGGQAVDIAQGIRVLRGIGGEAAFAERYRRTSAEVLTSGLRVGRIEALMAGQAVLFPGLLSVLVTWLAATYLAHGEISAGQLVAFYGYTAFLTLPMAIFSEAIGALAAARVAAGHILGLIMLEPVVAEPETPLDPPEPGAELTDQETGLRIRVGELLGIVCAEPDEAAPLAERLARYREGAVTLGTAPLDRLALATVRERIALLRNGDRFFAGTLRASLSGATPCTDAQIESALHAAAADDVLEGLAEGLESEVADAGRNFSGGQLQRLRLARALLAGPEILIAVEATSAVDTLTEVRMIERLTTYRESLGTVVFTTSPLVLDRCDRVVFLRGGRPAEGSHRELIAAEPAYRALIARESAQEDEGALR